jgi:uncharacterized protein GlcG (DUF336 family)
LARPPPEDDCSPRASLCPLAGRIALIAPGDASPFAVTDARLGALALHGASCLTGGIPLQVDGETVGAIGTSGETPDEDEAISIAGAAADFSTTELPALTYEGARLAAEAVGAEAARRGVHPVVSAVDAGGALVWAARAAFSVSSVETLWRRGQVWSSSVSGRNERTT